MMENKIITPENNKTDLCVGRYFKAWDGKTYYCDSYNPRIGYWMTEVDNKENRKNVSERAIGRTFHFDWRKNQ